MQHVLSYTKSNKLITALFMVTDVLDRDEPIRHKLRKLGTDILSDIHTNPAQSSVHINEVLSFLEIASVLKLVSTMNANVLTREFLKLNDAVKEYKTGRSNWLEDFLQSAPVVERYPENQNIFFRASQTSKTPEPSTRIGVQKAGSLMNAIKNVKDSFSSKQTSQTVSNSNGFDVLKKQRRADIVIILKTTNDGGTIKDIKDKAKGLPDKFQSIVSCGEKTLQRELVSMVKDGVLKKTGEKRWSRYSVN